MPHHARQKSESGYYHVVPKGLGDQIIFEDDSDRRLYIKLLANAKKEIGIRIHAYCLMSNHVHLILEDRANKMAEVLKYVHERYAAHFAEKTGRKGGIFSKPYWSEPIEADAYLLCAVRYVHANPAAAGICAASVYEWSSARDYLGKRANGITDTETVLEMCGGLRGFIQFSKPQNNTLLPFEGSKLKYHLSDDEAVCIAEGIVGERISTLKTSDPDTRKKAVRALKAQGFSKDRITRLSGLGRREIARILGEREW